MPRTKPTIAEEPALGRSVTIERAAELLKLSRRSVYYRIRDGRLQTVRTLGGSQRVLVQSLFEQGFQPRSTSTSESSVTVGFGSYSVSRAQQLNYR